MAGLLGDSWEDPRTMATLQLAAGLLSGKNFGQGMGAGVKGYQESMIAAQEQARRQKLAEAQMAETLAQAEQRKAEVAAAQRKMLEQQRIQEMLLGALRPVTGGEAATAGGMSPASAQMVGQQKPVDWQWLIANGVDHKKAEALANAPKLGSPEVARTIEEAGPDGQPLTAQFDKYGSRVGQGVRKPVEMKTMGLGGTTKVYNPFTLGPGDIAHTMTPEGKDASARGWASNALARERMVFDKGEQGKPPVGYRRTANGDLEAIPGGPADKKETAEDRAKNVRGNAVVDRAGLIIKNVDDALDNTGFFTTGLTGAAIGQVPGTPAYDLRRTVDTVKANIGFGELQAMREASPTGGALGQVAVQELNMLHAVLGNLDANQSEPNVKKQLGAVRKHYDNWKKVMNEAGFAGTTGGGPNVGEVKDGYRFKGGNPADKANWEKV